MQLLFNGTHIILAFKYEDANGSVLSPSCCMMCQFYIPLLEPVMWTYLYMQAKMKLAFADSDLIQITKSLKISKKLAISIKEQIPFHIMIQIQSTPL